MYSPKIEEELIPMLYKVSKEKKLPMTRLVNQLLREALSKIDCPLIVPSEDLTKGGSSHD